MLSHQMIFRLSVSVIPEECKEIILDEGKIENENLGFENLGISEANLILQTASSLFLSNIVIFYSVESEYQYIVIKAKAKNTEGPLHIFRHNNHHYESLDFSDNEITYDNLGRLHLAIPHTNLVLKQIQQFLDLDHYYRFAFNIEFEKGITTHTSFKLISDSGNDFHPVSLLSQIYLYRFFKKF